MHRTRYPYARGFAICLLGVALLTAACAPKKPVTGVAIKAPAAPKAARKGRFAPPPQPSPQIHALMRQALEEGRIDQALVRLQELSAAGETPLAVEARFRRVQLLLLTAAPGAEVAAEELLTRYGHHPLIPYLHLWLAKTADRMGNDQEVLEQTEKALTSPRLTREAAVKAASLGAAAARRSPDWEAVQWFLLVARSGVPDRNAWLRSAAARASIAMISRLRQEGRLRDPVGRSFYLQAARTRLVLGDMAAVRTLSDWLSQDFPHTKAAARVAAWAAGEMRSVEIGALLPLRGEYAAFGRQALRGMRLALDTVSGGDRASLRIADSDPATGSCLTAYRQLLDDGVEMILGPLIGDCTRTLAPQLRPDIPLISLTSRTELARLSPALFVHTLAIGVQARFLATRAWHMGDRKAVVIHIDTASSRREADIFSNTFVSLGGAVVARLELPQNDIDFRSQLRNLRMQTDDEELLAALDEEMVLSVLPPEMTEIRLPVGFDAVYLALPGRQVALLAGQLAYVGVDHVHLFGSSRWRDGHLLDDKGRYLGRALFTDVAFPNGRSPDVQRFKLAWREVWGDTEPTRLAGLAYDSTLIAVLLSSRLHLSGAELQKGLRDPAGFPGLTGHVHFDADGVGHKDFDVFRIRGGRIIPAG